MSLARSIVAELLGTTLLLACIVGSGVMGAKLSQGNDAVALLANAGATAGMLYVLVLILAPISGAHFNPAVTLTSAWHGTLTYYEAGAYILAQVIGAVVGVTLAHLMFDLPLVQIGTQMRAGTAQVLSEAVATFGLLVTIALGKRTRPHAVPALVAAYIFAAYWFTASTSFANPAVTIARTLTQTFAGIRPQDAAGFILGQLLGSVTAVAAVSILGVGATQASGTSGVTLQPPRRPTSRST